MFWKLFFQWLISHQTTNVSECEHIQGKMYHYTSRLTAPYACAPGVVVTYALNKNANSARHSTKINILKTVKLAPFCVETASGENHAKERHPYGDSCREQDVGSRGSLRALHGPISKQRILRKRVRKQKDVATSHHAHLASRSFCTGAINGEDNHFAGYLQYIRKDTPCYTQDHEPKGWVGFMWVYLIGRQLSWASNLP